MGLAPSGEFHWRSLLEDEQIFWNLFVPVGSGLIIGIILVVILSYVQRRDELERECMEKPTGELYNETVSILNAMKGEMGKNTQNQDERSSVKKTVEAVVLPEEASS
jgi:hypothetical protein